jgi:hypothetical protein
MELIIFGYVKEMRAIVPPGELRTRYFFKKRRVHIDAFLEWDQGRRFVSWVLLPAAQGSCLLKAFLKEPDSV